MNRITYHCVGQIGKLFEGFWKVILTNDWKEVNLPLENFYPTPETPNTLPIFVQAYRHALSCACWEVFYQPLVNSRW